MCRFRLSVARRAAMVLCVAALCAPAARSQARPAEASSARVETESTSRLQERAFRSESLARNVRYRILLPRDYNNSPRSYPVLYLLHGWHGDYLNWSTRTDLVHYADSLPIIIVMPDAGDSWYVDTSSQNQFERYIVKDLVKEVDEHWRTIRSPHRRAIAGLSMGGYGAVKFALKYPGEFRFAGSISGAFNAPDPQLAASREDLAPSLQSAFGDAASNVRSDNDVYTLAMHAVAAITPYLYLDCGTSDLSFIQPNRNLAQTLGHAGIAFEYHEYPGAHTWKYWDTRLPDLLRAAVRSIAAQGE